MNEFLKVILWGKEIGRLAWHPHKKTTYFIFNPDMLDGPLDIAPIVASIHDKRSHLPIYGEEERIYQKLPSFLADSLPDAWGNQLFEKWRIENKLPRDQVTPIEKLAFIGKRGMGALEFEPELNHGKTLDSIDLSSLANLARRIMTERENLRILPNESLTLQSLIQVGTSAGGRQPKAIIAMNSKTGEIRSGQVGGLDDFGYYILKFGEKERSAAEIEMTYFEMARLAGIEMMDSQLLAVDGINHFLTQRFDRKGTEKLHTQTLAALSPEADSYEKLLWVCRKLRLPEVDCREVFRRMVFNILANNTDDHNKNFTFIMNPQGTWRLAPAYDMIYTFDTGGFLPNHNHCLMIGGKLDQITREDVIRFAAENGIRRPEAVIRKVIEAISSFRSLAQKNGVQEQWIGRIEHCINEHLSAWGAAARRMPLSFTTLNGHIIDDAHIEQAYKGNFHLIATIDGKPYKYIIRIGTKEHEFLIQTGLNQVTDEQIKDLVEKFLLPKVK